MMKGVAFCFLWVVTSVHSGTYDDPQTLRNRQTMVHLFEWKWTDIANECETFLQYHGYGAVQVSPPQEHITLEVNRDRPWWIRYQPISYRLVSRSGTRAEFIDMVQRCNKVGVRIVIDAVINHMAGEGQKYGKNGVGDTMNNDFSAMDHHESFPLVPYSVADFHDSKCDHNINNWGDAREVRICRLVNLADLDQSRPDVRNAIKNYFNDLFSIGVAGVRVDAAKSIYPQDLAAIYASTNNLNSDTFGKNARMFEVGEIPDGGAVSAREYIGVGRVTNFDYGNKVAAAVNRGNNFNTFETFGPSWFGGLADNDALNFIDNHDTQRHNQPLTYKDYSKYSMAVSFMLAWNYGYPRVMSSYYFRSNDQGPPSSGWPHYKTNSPSFDPTYNTCTRNSGWVCEHRWPAIRNMAFFRSVTTGEPVTNIETNDHAIAFSRGDKGFFALNNGYNTWNHRFQTGMPAGRYCEIISGLRTNKCTSSITVDSSGYVQISIPASGMVAIHVGGTPAPPTGAPVASTTLAPTGSPSFPWATTVIFMHFSAQPGQNLFIRGGIGLQHRPFCPQNNGDLARNRCAMRIVHKTTVPSSFVNYLDWRQGDNYLDWYGAEDGQGTYNEQPAGGTPLAWSTNDKSQVGYQPLNHYGSDYWIVKLNMDCTNTVNGWFEFKGYESNGRWESDRNQEICSGTAGSSAPPYRSTNHFARCGFINVYEFNKNSCQISHIS